jgi:hypothetical protein
LTEQPPLLLRQLSHKYGEKPGPIDNKILSGDVAGSIQINLREGHSYVIVPKTLWVRNFSPTLDDIICTFDRPLTLLF